MRWSRPKVRAVPHPSRLAPDHPAFDAIVDAHRRALEDGEIGYVDPDSGLFVMSAGFLAERGYCCDTGCRHCPYVR